MHFFCCSIFLRVLSVSVFSLASRCPQFSVLYLGVPQDWVSLSLDTECFHFGAFYVACGILWPKETFLWQQIRARLHRETWVTHCTSGTQHWPRQRCAAAGQKLFPAQPTANAPILSTFDWNAPVDTNHWHSAASDLLQRFSNFYNNLSAAWKWRYVSPMMLKTFKSMYFKHLVCAFEHFNQASVLIEFCNFYFKIVSPWMKLCRWVLGEMNENVPSSHSERRRIKQRPNPTAGPKKLFWDIITHNIATRQKKFTLKQT